MPWQTHSIIQNISIPGTLCLSLTVFGAKWNFFQQKLSGRNIFVNPPFEVRANGKNLILKIIQKISDDLLSQKPTRALLLLPLLDGKESQITETATKAKFLEICTIPENKFPFDIPTTFREISKPIHFPGKVALYLAVNRASLKFDSIDWERFTRDLQEWCLTFCNHPGLFCEPTRKKFGERRVPSYDPRIPTITKRKETSPSSIYQYYDFRSIEINLQYHIKENRLRELISRMNKHDKLAGAIGILPHQLISLIKETHPNASDQITNELRYQTFWASYNLWRRRQHLQRTHWKEKTPQVWKSEEKRKKKEAKTPPKRKKRLPKAMQFEACCNPFHYLELVNFEKKPTLTCACSFWMTSSKPSRPNYLSLPKADYKNPSLPKTHDTSQPHKGIDKRISNQPAAKKRTNFEREHDDSGLDYKYPPNQLSSSPDVQYVKRSSQITTEHQDRSKRFKGPKIESFFHILELISPHLN